MSVISGLSTRSRTGSGKCFSAIAENFSAISLKASQSGFVSQGGSCAAENGWMNVCRSVTVMSDFSYQCAAGRTTSA